MMEVEVKKRILAANEAAADSLRRRFREMGTLVVNLISSPGSGKTTLLEATVDRLRARLGMAAIVGDIATERDADRLRRLGIPACQILTGGGCHLDARQVQRALDENRLGTPELLFIENVGNLVCPTSYDLGEDFKVVLLSVTEGEDKPFKYPAIFSCATVAVITKSDLMPHVDFDLEAVRMQIQALNPAGTILLTSSKTGDGLDSWQDLLLAELESKRSAVES
jgi:hydrogenase nickel incorporation protein HypB